jgi:hypothetical protein
LIRLKHLRPRLLPLPWGIGSENAAHRIAVEWEENGELREGVYIPRRDTNSRWNTIVGGRLFPGIHHFAHFNVQEIGDQFSIGLKSEDGVTNVLVSGRIAEQLPSSSVFPSIAAASAFFQRGAVGYSTTPIKGRFDGLELRCENWHVEPLDIDRLQSSFFEDESIFPPGSIGFDCALLMRGIEHEWHSREDLCSFTPVSA